ncbi:MAG: UvrD-helicase domain-containing protein, partial [Sphingomonadales bacterium]|nr:UvrD-helicase domain-containing protein [Sphingomonadales bacterium]
KRREGLIDFDDQIRQAAALLTRSGLADWIRYKLDRRFDHILVDEAQDTNAAQWRIIKAITGDFFTGEGARGDRLRTIFVVGDFKQAIFRFQGTSPENFRLAQEHFARLIDEAARNAAQLRDGPPLRPLQDLGLERSFRTAQTVLDVVDAAIAGIGHEGFGLDRAPERHVGEARPGHVVLWQPVGGKPGEGEDGGDAGTGEGEESWLSRPERDMADRIARQVRQWLDEGLVLHKGGARPASAGDIMVLVRKRRELAGLIVARLHAAGVPVAGVDRLRLGAPLAVRDLVAALRFAAQPLDDLSLAALLVSPLIGWTQEDLLEQAWRDKGVPLWDHLRRSTHPLVAQAMEQLTALLAKADYDPPQALLHWLLVGPWQGRRRLVARLGREANDPIDELLNAARAYAGSATPSLVGFLAWFDAGEGELKREAGKSDDLVRVMTVHGSKGLQAPIVILADATGDPKAGRTSPLDLAEPQRQPGVDPIAIPLPSLRKEERLGRLQAAADVAALEEDQEHWRLLYVAMTRAEEALYIGGALGRREDVPAEGSWYARLAPLFDAAGDEEDGIWGARRLLGDGPSAMARGAAEQAPGGAAAPLPIWLTRAPAAEPRPARPLAPSSLGEDAGSDPPFPPGALIEAARRG